MFTLTAPVRTRFSKSRGADIDNKVFRCHYILTSSLLLLFAVIYWAKEVVGEPITCLADSKTDDDTVKAINYYCWITSTYSVTKYFHPDHRQKAIYPGVGPLQRRDETINHTYYVWTSFFHLFLAVLFYVPRHIWRTYEGGRMKMLMEKLDKSTVDDEIKNTRLELVTKYFTQRLGYQNFYCYIFIFCEFLNFSIVLISFFLTDNLLSYQFGDYGKQVFSHWWNDGKDNYGQPVTSPMTKIFPKLTKCEFKKYGHGGNQMPIDTLCVLPLNNINDKVFLFLWFYFIVIGLISALSLLYRLITTFVPRIRSSLLKSKLLLRNGNNGKNAEFVSSQFHIGDWFVLFQLSKNIDVSIFTELVDKLASEMGNKNFDV